MRSKCYVTSIVLLTTLFSLHGCGRKQISSTTPSYTAPTTPRISKSFDEKQFEKYNVKGTASIKGQAFSKTAGGEIRYGAGETVYLVPVNSYTSELMPYIQKEQTIFYAGMTLGAVEKNLEGVDSRWRKYLKTTVADGFGNFEFTELAEGEYYVQCPVFWEIPTRHSTTTTGSVVSTTTKASKGETVKAILK
jgi:hypothetical protein